MKILITGAKGFLGSAFVNELAKAGKHEIIALVKDAGPNSNAVKYISADLSNSSFTDNIPGTADCVIYLAQSNQYRNFPSGAPDMFAVNTAAVASLLDWSSKNGVKKFIYASTGNVYEPRQELLKETHSTRPNSFYAASKLSAELLVQSYSGTFDTIVLRVFSLYGPGQQGMMIPGIIQKIYNSDPIALAENAGIYLTPLYIADAVKMLTLISEQPVSSGIYNFNGPETASLMEIVKILSNKIGKTPNLNITSNTPAWLAGDGSKLYQSINFKPETTLQEGLSLTIDEHKYD